MDHHRELELLGAALDRLMEGFADLPVADSELPVGKIRDVLGEVAARMRDNYPYQHPLYAGQMLKPPHPVARLAYALSLWINPNNHALDGGRASSAMEKEAVARLAEMFGWRRHLGHLTGGGTMANLEALWVAGRETGGRTVVASGQAHYTHERVCGVLGLPFRSVGVDRHGRMDPQRLEDALRRGDVGTVVVTLGTTALGAVDPLDEILVLQSQYGFRVHVDAAYGGYFMLAGNLGGNERAAFDRISEADSLVVDPHKHGLQPYGCGCVLFRDPSAGRFYQHDSPYTYFTSSDLHLGEISLECSRPGAAAVALWATQRLLPLERGGEFARMLESGRAAALELHAALGDRDTMERLMPPGLDILVWAMRGGDREAAGERARRVFAEAGARNVHLALARVPAAIVNAWLQRADGHDQVCLRSCLMKPEHAAWTGVWLERLDAATAAADA
jgi:glutamate/tyrosine decarboxylase-like PLP-dependent enzyme